MVENIPLSTKLIINEALTRGVISTHLCNGRLFKLKFNKHIEYLYNQNLSIISSVAVGICSNKYAIKQLLIASKISTPEGLLFNRDQLNDALKFSKKIKYPVVIKPTGCFGGEGVYCNIVDDKELKKNWQEVIKKYDAVIIEKYFSGNEYRILATKNKAIGIINRVPSNVIGDGIHTIKQLIEIKNEARKKLPKIIVDNIVLTKLKKDSLHLNKIIENHQRVFLRNNSNISTGGDGIDATDIAHASAKKIAVEAINSIPGLLYGGVDMITEDIQNKQTNKSYTVLEVNDSPGIKSHHYPTQGKPRNVAKEIIDIAFPETKKSLK